MAWDKNEKLLYLKIIICLKFIFDAQKFDPSMTFWQMVSCGNLTTATS